MATETFTLTLDDAPTESVSVTINDTSQTQAGEQIFSTAGSYQFTVPVGVTSINIYMVGAGGGGAVGEYSTGSAGGGGGGAFFYAEGLTVSPGDIFNGSIGAGGARGTISTNNPFEIVSTNSATGLTKYPQSGTVTAATNGGTTSIVSAQDSNWYVTLTGGARGRVITGGAGGVLLQGSSVQGSAPIIGGGGGKAGRNGTSGNSGTTPGGGGGAHVAGNGGNGRGDFYRSTGGYNYYKAGAGGRGGGAYLYGSWSAGSQGSNAPALVTSTSPLRLNYDGGDDGGTTGSNTGTAYGGGGGGGAGGRIRNQTIISGSTRYYYRWFLAGPGTDGISGAVRFSWGT